MNRGRKRNPQHITVIEFDQDEPLKTTGEEMLAISPKHKKKQTIEEQKERLRIAKAKYE